MPAIPTPEANPDGLHSRYVISKSNGEPVDDTAVYFVLRLDCDGGDSRHIQACRWAAREYTRRILADEKASHLHQTAVELHQLIHLLEEWNDPDEGYIETC